MDATSSTGDTASATSRVESGRDGEHRASSYPRGVLESSAQARAQAVALAGMVQRVAGAVSTAEERAVRVVETILAELGAAVAVAWHLTDEGTLEMVGATPLAADLRREHERIALAADCPVAEAARTGGVITGESRLALLDRYPDLQLALDALGLEAAAVAPAWHLGRVNGVLAVGWTAPRSLTNGEQVSLRMMAGRLARALAASRLYYAERAAHLTAERARAAEAEARCEAEQAQADAEVSRRIAEEANRAKDDFLAVVSHELRTPLQAILGFSELLTTEIVGPLAPRQHEYVRRVQAAGGHLLDTIENLLGFARAQAGKDVVVATRFDAAAVVTQVIEIAAPLAARKQLTLAQTGLSTGVTVVTDERKVRQIVTNLVANAIKFTESGSVTVDVALVEPPDGGRGDACLCIVVRDTGIGIPAEQLERVFEPFTQVTGGVGASTTTRPTNGTGLGLSIVRQLTRALGGEVTATSDVGQGSAFTVQLPAVVGGAPPESKEPVLR